MGDSFRDCQSVLTMSGIGQDIGENELHRVEAELSELSFSQLFSPDAIYQCSIRGCVDDMRVRIRTVSIPFKPS